MSPNRLARETSPYLLQHAHNPVDWYPWGEEALERARREEKPILLSVGYAACHWCHVMERESFEEPETARVMNELFVNVKVDREERPDLDSIYMNAVQAMTGHGGWPMTVFLTPDGRPFYGGTYFPPEDRHGLPSFRRVLEAVDDAWRTRRSEIEQQSSTLVEHIGRTSLVGASPEPLQEATLFEAARAIAGASDEEWGGFDTPKFPQAPSLEFLLCMHARGVPETLPPLALVLRRMARGGIFDHVGGGFHRYAVDRAWQVPHFEKMLYDNAQLLRLYARAWLATSESLYRDAAERTAEYLLRDLRHPDGGFFSSQDADSEGEEGKFYVWSLDEVRRVCNGDAEAVIHAFDVRPEGNWEGTNVLWMPRDDEVVAAQAGATTAELRAAIARALPRLREARAGRVPPATDDKILAGWNGLAISGLAEAGRAFGRTDFVDGARAAAEFVLAALGRPDGRLLRAWRGGRAGVPAFLDDYAMMAAGLLDLYETTFEPRWFEEAERLGRETIRLFADDSRGGFFDTGSDTDALVLRPKTIFDNATPSGNSVAAETLLRLAALTGDTELEHAGAGPLRLANELMTRAPLAFGCALRALDLYVHRPAEVAIVGDPASDDTRDLASVAWGAWRTNRVLAVGPPGSGAPPLLRDRQSVDGRATAYVCRGFVCDYPKTDVAGLAASLAVASR